MCSLSSTVDDLLDLVYEPREVCVVCSQASTVDNLLGLVYHSREVCVVWSLAYTEDNLLDLVYHLRKVLWCVLQPTQRTFWAWSVCPGQCVFSSQHRQDSSGPGLWEVCAVFSQAKSRGESSEPGL